MLVTINDVRAAGLCPAGLRTWAKRRGMPASELRDFLQNGWPIEKLEAIDDPFAQRVSVTARARFAAEATRG